MLHIRILHIRILHIRISHIRNAPALLVISAVAAADSPLNRYFELDATTTYDRLWYGKYITVAPLN